MAVFVLDKRKKPLMPCSEKRARKLLDKGRAVVDRMQPFTIRLKDRTLEESETQPLRTKIDPGSKTTGLAVVREDGDDHHVLWLGELEHRGSRIRDQLSQRRAFRRRRRSANLRYRAPRFSNRTRSKGWLVPSLQHRVDTTASWVARLQKLAPVTGLSMELAKFDTQLLEDPDIQGVEYQRGTLHGTEVWEYLLESWGRQCVYCDEREVPLTIDHIVPRARGGSDRVGNLTVSCVPCNEAKSAQPLEAFLEAQPERLARIQSGSCRTSYRDAAALNSTRWALFRTLEETGLPLEAGTGGRTKWNRRRHDAPKTHAHDAACVGRFETLHSWQRPTLAIKATGRGSYKRTRLTKYGFPRGYLMRQKRVQGFQTGDHVQAIVPQGARAGTHVGRVAVRASGSFNIRTKAGTQQGIHHRHCRVLQKADGYAYTLTPTRGRETERRALHGALFLPALNDGVSRANI